MKGGSRAYRFAILFPENDGCLFVKQLPAGAFAAPQLVYSTRTGKMCVRKLTKNINNDRDGFPLEVTVGRSLANSGFIPKILQHDMVDKDDSVIVFEYCDGGDLDNYVKNQIREEKDAEVLIWHVIARVTRITTYLQTGWVGRHTKATKDGLKQDYDESIVVQPGWKPIFHGDLHPGNILLDFARCGTDGPANQPLLPRVLLGDFGYACYDAPDALDLANLLEELYKLVGYGAVYECSAEGREELMRTLSPFFVDRMVPRVAEAFQALVPVAEEKVRSYKTANLPRPEVPRGPMLFDTLAPMAPERFVVDSLGKQKPWKWVKIKEEDVERGRFSVFEEVSEAEIEMAEANRQFFLEGGRPEMLGK